MNALRQVGALCAKDLLIEWRTRDLLSTMVVLGFTSILLFNFAVDFGVVPFKLVGAPVLWMAFLFTGVTGIARSFALERENRCLEGLLLSPSDRSVLYAGKLLVNFVVLLAFGLLLLALSLVFLNQGRGAVDLPLSRWAAVAGILALESLGLAAVGTLFALMAQRTRRGEVLLPVLQSILALPVLLCGVMATRKLVDVDVPLDAIEGLVRLSAVFDIVFIALALVVFEFVVEE